MRSGQAPCGGGLSGDRDLSKPILPLWNPVPTALVADFGKKNLTPRINSEAKARRPRLSEGRRQYCSRLGVLLSRPCNSDNQPFERLVEKAIEQNRDDDDNEKKLADAERMNSFANERRVGEINKMDV